MGTHIDCLIPKEIEFSDDEVFQKLNDVFKNLEKELRDLQKFGKFSENMLMRNWVRLITTDDQNYFLAECGSFEIEIYDKLVYIGCLERFSSFYNDENISKLVYKILSEVSNIFRKSEKILI